MRQQLSLGKGWFPILLVLFLCASVYMSGSMGSAKAAYSPTVSYFMQAGEPTPGEGGHGKNHNAASHGGMTPAQSRDLMQEEEMLETLLALAPELPSQQATAHPAVRSLMNKRPLSELASQTGGHAPPF